MSLLSLFSRPTMEQGLSRFRETPGAVLLDVRTREEYAGGFIPGSRNLPLQELAGSSKLPADRGTPLYVYCLSGGRSRQAAGLLRRMGYTEVVDLGGIHRYHGKVMK